MLSTKSCFKRRAPFKKEGFFFVAQKTPQLLGFLYTTDSVKKIGRRGQKNFSPPQNPPQCCFQKIFSLQKKIFLKKGLSPLFLGTLSQSVGKKGI